MRILHVAPSVSRADGGPSEVLRGLLPAQGSLGHDVELIATDQGASEDERVEAIAPVTHLAPSHGPHALAYGRGLRSALRVALKRADVVHVHGVYTYTSVLAMRAARARGVPMVVQPHGVWTPDHQVRTRVVRATWDKLVLSQSLPESTRLIGSSHREVVGITARGYQDARLMILGVPPALATIATPWTERRGVLFLGRITQKKRLDLTLRAFARSVARDAGERLVVAGPVDPALQWDPRALCDELGIADFVQFLGPVSAKERFELLASCRVFVLPSDDESFGMAAAEAACAGAGVVVTERVGAIADAAAKGVAVTRQQDPEDLARGIDGFFEDAEGAMARVLSDYARATWTWSTAAGQACSAYGSLM